MYKETKVLIKGWLDEISHRFFGRQMLFQICFTLDNSLVILPYKPIGVRFGGLEVRTTDLSFREFMILKENLPENFHIEPLGQSQYRITEAVEFDEKKES